MNKTPNSSVRRMLLRALRVRVAGDIPLEELLLKGRVVVASNHVSFLDGVVVALASPVPLIFPVDTAFSQDAFFSRHFLSLLEWFGWGEVVPMDSAKPAALKTLKRRLDAGANVLIFPEGQISPDGQPRMSMPGTDWLVRKTGAKRIELQIDGAEKSLLFGKAGSQLWPSITLTFSMKGRGGQSKVANQEQHLERFLGTGQP